MSETRTPTEIETRMELVALRARTMARADSRGGDWHRDLSDADRKRYAAMARATLAQEAAAGLAVVPAVPDRQALSVCGWEGLAAAIADCRVDDKDDTDTPPPSATEED